MNFYQTCYWLIMSENENQLCVHLPDNIES